MAGQGRAFAKGGLGCLGLFAVIAVLALMAGGQVHIDLGGACCLFVIGGLIGLLVLAIYNKGQSDAKREVLPSDYDPGSEEDLFPARNDDF